jgi:hypothetical protein
VVGRPRWVSIFTATVGSEMYAMTVIGPRHVGQTRTSTAKTLRKSWCQGKTCLRDQRGLVAVCSVWPSGATRAHEVLPGRLPGFDAGAKDGLTAAGGQWPGAGWSAWSTGESPVRGWGAVDGSSGG